MQLDLSVPQKEWLIEKESQIKTLFPTRYYKVLSHEFEKNFPSGPQLNGQQIQNKLESYKVKFSHL